MAQEKKASCKVIKKVMTAKVIKQLIKVKLTIGMSSVTHLRLNDKLQPTMQASITSFSPPQELQSE